MQLFDDELELDDIVSRPMGSSGDDLMLSPAAQRLFPFSVECKCVENLSIWSALTQATARLKDGRVPVVVASKNRRKYPVVVLPLGWLYGVQTKDPSIVNHSCLLTCGGTDSLTETLSDLNHCHLRDDGLLDFGGIPMMLQEKKACSFWKTVETHEGKPIIFNRGDPNHVIYVTLPWPMFTEALIRYRDVFIASSTPTKTCDDTAACMHDVANEIGSADDDQGHAIDAAAADSAMGD